MVVIWASSSQKIPISGAGALLVAGGSAVVAGLIAAATTQQDGTRNVRRKYDGEYQLRPTSKDAAKASIDLQRFMGGTAIVGGTAVLGFQALTSPGLGGAILGGALLGGGIGKLIRLSGAEEQIDEALPDHTAAGQPDMTRHNKHMYQQEGAGYNAYGVYQGARWGQSSLSPTYQQHTLDRMRPTISNGLHLSTYLGGNVQPGGRLGFATPTGLADANATSQAAVDRFGAEQELLARLRLAGVTG